MKAHRPLMIHHNCAASAARRLLEQVLVAAHRHALALGAGPAAGFDARGAFVGRASPSWLIAPFPANPIALGARPRA